MTHWHDTPEFDRIRDARVDQLRSKDRDTASNVCAHGSLAYHMTEPKSGRTWFLCRSCCQKNVELQLLVLDKPPA